MRDFIKWLGVNEKVAKVAVWLLIIMVSLIIFNAAFESLGFPYYKITVDNLSKINPHKAFEVVLSWLVTFLNFYSIIFLVFRVKEFRKTLKYAVLYLVLCIVVNIIFGYAATQIFMILYIILFSFFYSEKNWKYILFAIISMVVNAIVQYIWYMYKARFIDLSTINQWVRSLLVLDFFIIMAVIILVKEIYIKKKR